MLGAARNKCCDMQCNNFSDTDDKRKQRAVFNGFPFVMTPSGAAFTPIQAVHLLLIQLPIRVIHPLRNQFFGCTNSVGAVCNVVVETIQHYCLPMALFAQDRLILLRLRAQQPIHTRVDRLLLLLLFRGLLNYRNQQLWVSGANTAVLQCKCLFPIPIITVSSGTICSGSLMRLWATVR